MRRLYSRFGFGLACSAVVVASTFAGIQSKKPPAPSKPDTSLIDLSSRVVDLVVLRTWLAQHDNVPVDALDGLNWLSPDVILAHDNHGDGAFLEAYVLNLRTGERLRQPQLTRAISRQGYLKPGDWQLSSDKKWLLWRDGWQEKDYHFFATALDGSLSIKWNAPKATQDAHRDSYFWITGTHKWVNLYSADGKTVSVAQLYDLEMPAFFHSVPLTTQTIGTHFLGRSADGTIWTADDDRAEKTTRASVTAFRLQAPTHARRYTLSLPAGESVQQISMSPDCRTLAALSVSAGQRKYTLWRSGPDGTGLRRIAGLAFDTAGGRIGLDGWTPDGHKLLFHVEKYAAGGQGSYELREAPIR